MKAKFLIFLIAPFVFSTAYASHYVNRAPLGVSLGAWKAYTNYSDWVNNGDLYNCSSYSPLADTINYGNEFTQAASCSQEQIRTKYTYEVSDIDGSMRNNKETSQSQAISVTTSKIATGTLNYIVSSSSEVTYNGYESYSNCDLSFSEGETITVDSARYYKYNQDVINKTFVSLSGDAITTKQACDFKYKTITNTTNVMADGSIETSSLSGYKTIHKVDFVNENLNNGVYIHDNTYIKFSFDGNNHHFIIYKNGVMSSSYSCTARFNPNPYYTLCNTWDKAMSQLSNATGYRIIGNEIGMYVDMLRQTTIYYYALIKG